MYSIVPAKIHVNAQLHIYLIIAFHCAMSIAIYFSRNQRIEESTVGSPIAEAFNHNDSIIYALIFNLSISGQFLLELLLDVSFGWKNLVDDRTERAIIVFSIAFSDIWLIFSKSSVDLPFLFCTTHVFQFAVCFCCVISLCNKLIPNYFTHKRVFFMAFTYSICCIFGLLAFAPGNKSWESILSLTIGTVNQVYFASIFFLWLRSLNWVTFKFILIPEMNVNEKAAFLYITTTIIILTLTPGIIGFSAFYEWQNYDKNKILAFIYTLTAFTLVPACLPGRLARHYFVTSQLQVEAAQASKWATLRYLSHELRSPLNVVANGIKFAIEDSNCEVESANDLHDVYHACKAAIHLLDDLLNVEKLEAGLLVVEKAFVSIAEIMEDIVDPLKIYAKQKGIAFKSLVVIPEDTPSQTVGALMDKFKIEQVLRNLCVNAVKFTPSGGTVTVTIRTETLVSESEPAPGDRTSAVAPDLSGGFTTANK